MVELDDLAAALDVMVELCVEDATLELKVCWVELLVVELEAAATHALSLNVYGLFELDAKLVALEMLLVNFFLNVVCS